jgi:hypothetical protein
MGDFAVRAVVFHACSFWYFRTGALYPMDATNPLSPLSLERELL